MGQRSGKNAPRKPATKFAHLRRKLQQNQLAKSLSDARGKSKHVDKPRG